MTVPTSSKVPHPIPYQGSKRGLASCILSYFPSGIERLIEPFAGSAAVSLAAAYTNKASAFHLNDVNGPLMALWHEILTNPLSMSEAYSKLWHAQIGDQRAYYDLVRSKFNKTQEPRYLLYLLARCVKASVRYNSNGEFNQSPDNRRLGSVPSTMRFNLCGASMLLGGRCTLSNVDYAELVEMANESDLVYLDPPYQGVCGDRDQRYVEKIAYDHFVGALTSMNRRKISYIVSYDGRTGLKEYGIALPDCLKLKRIEVKAGRSTQATLLGRSHDTFESLYLSPALLKRLKEQPPVPVGTLSLLEAAA